MRPARPAWAAGSAYPEGPGGRLPGRAARRVVVAGGFGVVLDGLREVGQGGEVFGGPHTRPLLTVDAELVEGLLGLGQAAGLLVVEKDAGYGVEGFGAFGMCGELGAGLGDEGALLVLLLENRIRGSG